MKKTTVMVVLPALIAAWWLAIYLPGAGTGFLKDDFGWIEQSRVQSFREAAGLLTKNNGFYRPAVGASFALNYAVFGLTPLPFGLTNLLLAGLVALSVARLALALRLPAVAALVAAAAWALNPHGINMAVLWTSGRTALLLTLFATLAATALVKRHALGAAAWTFLALLSKEEAVVLPFVMLAWLVVLQRMTRVEGTDAPAARRLLWPAIALFVVLALYFALRLASGAFTPGTAPSYYRFSTDWHVLAANLLQYLDRAGTFPTAVVLVAMLAARRVPRLDANARAVAVMCVIWIVGGYALTVWLPVRSSLYACLPSVGAAVIAGALVSGLVESETHIRAVPAVVAVCAVAVVSTPIYWTRNERWVGAGRTSTAVLTDLPAIVADKPPGMVLVMHDGNDPRTNLKAAFGTLLPEAVRLSTGRRDIAVWVDPPPGDWALAGWRQPQPGDKTASFTLDGHKLRPAS